MCEPDILYMLLKSSRWKAVAIAKDHDAIEVFVAYGPFVLESMKSAFYCALGPLILREIVGVASSQLESA
jgi:hypothetical protein